MSSQFRAAIRSVLVIAVIAFSTAALFRSWSLALIVTLGLAFHELGHIVAASYFGVRWELILNQFGVGTLTSLREREGLSQFQNSIIHLAGPAASLVLTLIMLEIGVFFADELPSVNWILLANFSALLALMNGLPFGGISDGGRFLKRLFASLPERLGSSTMIGLLTGLISSVWLLSVTGYELVGLGAILLIGLWLVSHMLLESLRNDPSEAYSPKAMTALQSAILLGVLIGILLVSTIVILNTPFWITINDFKTIASELQNFYVYSISQGRVALLVLLLLGVSQIILRFSPRKLSE